MIKNLSKATKTALINTEPRQGATVPYRQESVWTELEVHGYVGALGGLTRKGLIAREQIMAEKLKEAFGA